MKILKAAAVSIALLSTAANAESFGVKSVDIITSSKHINFNKDLNEINPGLMLNFENNFSMGVVYNSEEKVAPVIKYTWIGDQAADGFKFTTGIETRVSYGMGFAPLALFEYRYKNFKIAGAPIMHNGAMDKALIIFGLSF